MKKTPPAYVPRKSGLMEFEPVSIEAARASIEQIPEGMAAMLSNEYWQKVRRAPLATDRALLLYGVDPFSPKSVADGYRRGRLEAPRIVRYLRGLPEDHAPQAALASPAADPARRRESQRRCARGKRAGALATVGCDRFTDRGS